MEVERKMTEEDYTIIEEMIKEDPINRNIPEVLKNFKFVKLQMNSKKPSGKKWEIKNYNEIQEDVWTGNNYGILMGNNHIAIDIDSSEFHYLVDKLPLTYTQKTAKGFHLIYKFKGVKSKTKLKHNDNNIGDFITGNA